MGMKIFQVIKLLHKKKKTAKQTKTFQHELNIIKQTVVDKKKTPQIKFKSSK